MTANYIDINRLYCICFSLITLSVTNINSRTSSHWIFSATKDQVVPIFNKRTTGDRNCQSCIDKECIDVMNCENMEQTGDDNMELKGRQMMEILVGSQFQEIVRQTEEKPAVHGPMRNSEFKPSGSVYSPKITEFPTTINRLPDIDKAVRGPVPTENQATQLHTSQYFKSESASSQRASPQSAERTQDHLPLSVRLITCHPYVNQTQYDHLNGIHNRDSFRFLPEPEVALVFSKPISGSSGKIEINLNELERQLLEDKNKRPRSPSVYNNIGNFLRIHGRSKDAVECFRSALYLSPHNADVLLNLARVLYNQNYLEDAIYLTRHSLETQPQHQQHNTNVWLQHFTLGEILQSTGHLEEAKHHFKHVLKLNPGFQPAVVYLQEMEATAAASADSRNSTFTIYSIAGPLLFLVLVLYVVFVNIEFAEQDAENHKMIQSRNMNRYRSSMKSLRMLHCRSRPKR